MSTTFKRLALISASAAALAASASGAAFAGDWDGLTLGAGGGYAMTNNEFNIGPGAILDGVIGGSGLDINGLSGTGGFATLSAGYDKTLLHTLVVGAFVDYDFADIDSSIGISIPPIDDLNASAHFKIDNQLSIGARLGYLMSPSSLFFLDAGYAHVETSDVKFGVSGPVTLGGTLASVGSFDGYFIGGGLETMLRNGFSIKAEYRYTSLMAENATVLPGNGINDFVTASIKPQIQSARLSLNYHFGDGVTEPVDNSIPPITSSWTGPYLGIGTGYSVANNKTTLADRSTPPGSIFSAVLDGVGDDGGFIAATAGYDYQLGSKFVIGAFADADYSNLHHDNKLDLTAPGLDLSGETESEFKNILMVGGRFGYLTTPDTLVFASVGYANAGLGDTNLSGSLNGGSASLALFGDQRFSGAFFGGGIETKIWDSLSLKAEYRYLDLGSESMTLLPDTLPEINEIVSTKFDPSIQMGRISLNYRFGGRAETDTAPLK
jgi:outer membrane immunogenic protein